MIERVFFPIPLGAALAVGLMVLTGCVPAGGVATVSASAAISAKDHGLQLVAAHDYKAAKVELTKAKVLQSDDAHALMALAAAADMTDDFRLADRAYDRLLTLTDDRAVLFNNMGYSYMLRGDLRRALEYLGEAARLQPDNKAIANNLKMLRSVTVM